MPTNWLGYQQPLDGIAYAGLGTFGTGATYTIREFLGAKLTQPLIPGTRYYASVYISATSDNNQNICYSNNMGLKLSTQVYSYSSPAPIDNQAHLYSSQVITDTVAWLKLEGSFIADSAYEYIILGNFFDDANTIVTGCNTTSGAVGAYYYVDNVCVSTDSSTCNITTGTTSSLNKPVISIYPNPATDLIAVDFPSLLGHYSIVIYDALGQSVLEKPILTDQLETINISWLKSGLLLICITHNNQIYHFKHFKQ